MASLTGNQVGASYLGIIKTENNATISAAPIRLTDGAGNALSVCATNSSLIFTGTADFSGATVTGISATDTTYDLTSAQAGSNSVITLTGSDATADNVTLVAGTNVTLTDDGSNSITIDADSGTDTRYNLASAQSGADVNVNLSGTDASLDTVKLVAGTNVTLTDSGSNQVTIDASGGAAGLESGLGADSMQSSSALTISPADATGACSIVLGNGAFACLAASDSVTLGTGAKNYASESVVIGLNACNYDASRLRSVFIGSATRGAQCTVGIGYNSNTLSSNSASLGSCTYSNANESISIGYQACVSGGGSTQAIAIGSCALTTAQGAAAIGHNVSASRANYTTSCGFEACVAGQGMVVTSPDGLTTLGIGIDNAGNIVTYTP